MIRPLPALLVVLVCAVLAATPASAPAASALSIHVADKQRGVCFVAGREIEPGVFDPLVTTHVGWISQTPFGWQEHADDTSFDMVTGGWAFWGESDRGIEATTRMARARGIRTLLKPHLWLRDTSRDQWVGSIAMKNEADWRRWFDAYERFILHYAALARDSGMDALCIGTELAGTSGREADWRRVIADVRRSYKGPIVYAANWSDEFERVRFWDAVDYIGIQAYFPLSQSSDPSVEELVRGWQPYRAHIEAVARRYGRPVLFTEIGYKASDRATVEPWLWKSGDRTNPEAQARAYEAAFRVFWHEPWFAGMYWWKWFPHYRGALSMHEDNFTPQGKPATGVLTRWYAPAR